jgi:hypothetical protein
VIQIYSALTPVIAGGIATVTLGCTGTIRAVGVRFSGAPSGTVTAVLKHNMAGVAAAVDEPLLTTVAATNRMYSPLKPGQIAAGTDLAGSFVPYIASGQIVFSIAGGPNGQTVSFQVFVGD